MHELSICQALLTQVSEIAASKGAVSVQEINIDIGVLSGVEPELLSRAFEVACQDTIALGAKLIVNKIPVVIRCRVCEQLSETRPNNLSCPACGDWRSVIVQGDELQLRNIVLERPLPGEIRRNAHV